MPKFVFDATFVVNANSREEAEVALMEALQGVDDGSKIIYEHLDGGEEVD